MAYLIYMIDKPGSRHIREAYRAAHYSYLERFQGKLIASGGLQDDGGEFFIGGAILLDVDSRAEAEAFVAGDPFTEAGLCERVVVHRWKKAFFDGVRV